MVFQKSAHSGAYGELCSASEHVNTSSISADGRQRTNRGSSNDEHLTPDGLISEDLRAGGPHLCTLPEEWRPITEDHPLYSRLTPDRDLALKIFDICYRFNVFVEAVVFCTFQSVLQPEDQPIFTAFLPAKKRDKNEDWVSLSREVLQFLYSEGIAGISVEIRDARAAKPDACFPIVESDAIFAVWGKVLDSILDFCDTQDWNSVGCYHIGKEEKNWSQNPATVLVTVDKTASSRDWRASREAVVTILDAFELPMVAVKIVGADIVCAASPTPTEFPNTKDLLESTVRAGESVGRCHYEGECGTIGGWIEVLDRETDRWRVFGLTCSHVALPDNANIYTDSNGPVVYASGTRRDVPSRTWADGSATSVDWALIDATEQCKSKTNKVSSKQIKGKKKIQS